MGTINDVGTIFICAEDLTENYYDLEQLGKIPPHRSFVDICILVIMTLKSGCPPSENFGNQCITTTDGGLLDVDQAGSVQLLSPEQVLPDDLTAIKEYAAQKKLCAEQVVEVEAFIKVSILLTFIHSFH